MTAGRDVCALCGEAVRPDDDAVVTPDFLADDSDPFWRFSDAIMHRPCFVVWDRRKTFIARFNEVARRFVLEDGRYQHMTGDGGIVHHRSPSPPRTGPPA